MTDSRLDSEEPQFDPTNTARATRARFAYQDQCVAYRCAQNLVTPGGLSAVIVEWSSDYLAVPSSGPTEVVSIKHREHSTRSWTPSDLTKPVADLHRYWREMDEECRCVFASNRSVLAAHDEQLRMKLASALHVPAAEAERFGAALDLVTPALPDRADLPALGRATVRGALEALGRRPRFAAECWDALVSAVERLSIEAPPTDEERAVHLAGAARQWRRSDAPALAEQTLRLSDLRARVLATHDDLEQEVPRKISFRPGARPLGHADRRAPRAELTLGALRYAERGPAETIEAPDASATRLAVAAWQLSPPERNVRLSSVRVRRVSPLSDRWLAGLRDEAALLRDLSGVPGVPRLAAEVAVDRDCTLVTVPPAGRTLDAAFGPLTTPYSASSLEALLRGLSALGTALGSLHQRGLSHRDLRPATLTVEDGGAVGLRDVGLALMPALPGEGDANVRAPEQYRAGRTSTGTDVYQLAAVVYAAATGRPPGRRLVPATVWRPDLAPGLERLLGAGLEASPAGRPAITDFCTALARSAGISPRGGC
ncbi:hypothetical protein [Cryptosporangium sp. NPDC051539]|uniref:hypothetical protein n=1 Tax=Cryptosporangium sp. NPDC051539 TaxID=3363962 RepID=UPI0037B9C4BA